MVTAADAVRNATLSGFAAGADIDALVGRELTTIWRNCGLASSWRALGEGLLEQAGEHFASIVAPGVWGAAVRRDPRDDFARAHRVDLPLDVHDARALHAICHSTDPRFEVRYEGPDLQVRRLGILLEEIGLVAVDLQTGACELLPENSFELRVRDLVHARTPAQNFTGEPADKRLLNFGKALSIGQAGGHAREADRCDLSSRVQCV